METTENGIRREIEATRAAMADKIETLEARVGGAIQGAKRSVNPKYQTQQRPLVMMGIAVVVGYLLEGVLFGKASRGRKRKYPSDPERRAYLEGQQRNSGVIRTLATAAGVALAREFATSLISKRR
ncbi:MAG: hypothetical protein GEU77_20275 [Deltaproteobacteria bacterium]|nr:hypothetical protein [Deltaproteobacteria bacterium]